MFIAWGAFVHRHRRLVLGLAILLGVLGASAAGRASSVLVAGGWLDPTSPSARAADVLAEAFGGARSGLVVLYRGEPGTDATDPAFLAAVEASVAGVRDDPDVTGVVGWAETGDARFLSADRTATYVVVRLDVDDEGSVAILERLEARLGDPGPGIERLVSGYAPFTRDLAEQSERDLLRAELVSLPVAAVVLLVVFGSLVAAGIPLLVAGLAIPSTLALVWLAGQALELSLYVENISTMLGLALAIDYSLFLVSRFREELRAGRPVGDAVAVTVGTSGKAVTFSGIAVAIGLAGLLAFDAPALRSFGVGGVLTVTASLLYALTFLPALLGVLGPRIDALSVGALVRRLRGRGAAAGPSRWERVAHAVMARPVTVLVPTLALLLGLGVPFLGIEQGIPGAATLPAGLESREAALALERDFPAGATTPIEVVVRLPGAATDPAAVRSLAAYTEALAAVPGVDRVDGPFGGIRNPGTGAPLPVEQLVALYGVPRSAWPAPLGALWDAHVADTGGGAVVRLDVVTPASATRPEGTAMVPLVRAVDPGLPGAEVLVGGVAATGHDFLASQTERIPVAVGAVLAAMAVVLFLLFGSVAIPLKAIVMTLLSITASFGALVWIFQEGNLAGPLGFTSPGFTMAGVPIIMFCVLFGLSMDYEVLLLSRVQEAWHRTGDNRASVAEGLARTAGVITGAAAIMISVFAAFSLAETLTIKTIGVGMAIAVLADATIVRVLLVPATMRLLGRWNWWAPGPLGRLAARTGFAHLDGSGEPPRP